jgi:transcriptional regulator with GAF, ATPase, and Fis domain
VIRAADLPSFVRGTPATEVAGDDESFHAQRTEAERRIVLAALERHDWQITRTAESLALADHASLLKIMRRLGIQRG